MKAFFFVDFVFKFYIFLLYTFFDNIADFFPNFIIFIKNFSFFYHKIHTIFLSKLLYLLIFGKNMHKDLTFDHLCNQ